MIDLVITLDYEIFGNGAGDVMRDVVRPTNRLLDICDRYGVKMTIMFEVGEYWAFAGYDTQLRKNLGYSPSEQMRKQAIDAIRRGHDVQLHLHPQWIGADYKDGVWRLNNAYWRLADLPDGLGSKDQVTSITGALFKGKQTLEDMIKPVNTDYQCVCYRAGGFYAQPSRNIICAMKRVGLKCDSSVVKGFRTSAPFEVDYSQVKTDKAAWWTTDKELTEEGRPGENIIELPVSSRIEPYWKNFKLTKLLAALKRRELEKACRENISNGNGIHSVPAGHTVLMKLLKKHAGTFDFCKLSCKDMLERVREFYGCGQSPVVVIGHSKDFINDSQFDEFLAMLHKDEKVTFQSMSEYVQGVIETAGHSQACCLFR